MAEETPDLPAPQWELVGVFAVAAPVNMAGETVMLTFRDTATGAVHRPPLSFATLAGARSYCARLGHRDPGPEWARERGEPLSDEGPDPRAS